MFDNKYTTEEKDYIQRDADFFEYISALLHKKNFEPMSETISLMDFKELQTMKPKSKNDVRRKHIVEKKPVIKPTVGDGELSFKRPIKQKSKSMYNLSTNVHLKNICLPRSKSMDFPLIEKANFEIQHQKHSLLPRSKSCFEISKKGDVIFYKRQYHSMSSLFSKRCQSDSLTKSDETVMRTSELSKWKKFGDLVSLTSDELHESALRRFDGRAVNEVLSFLSDDDVSFTCSDSLTDVSSDLSFTYESIELSESLTEVSSMIDDSLTVEDVVILDETNNAPATQQQEESIALIKNKEDDEEEDEEVKPQPKVSKIKRRLQRLRLSIAKFFCLKWLDFVSDK